MTNSTAATTQIGATVTARVTQILSFGAFVRLDDGTEGYVRRREVTLSVNIDPREVLRVGQRIVAVVIEPARPGRRLELSLRRLAPDPWRSFTARLGDVIPVTVKHVYAEGILVEHVPGLDGFIPVDELLSGDTLAAPETLLHTGDRTEGVIIYLDQGNRRLLLSVRRWADRLAVADDVVDRLGGERRVELDALPGDSDFSSAFERPTPAPLGAPILIVEDQDEVRDSLMARLRNWGYEVVGAESAEQALARCAEQPFALAIIDLDMPIVNGLQLITWLAEQGHDLPIAVMSVPDLIAHEYDRLCDLGVALTYDKLYMEDDILVDLQRLAQGERPRLSSRRAVALPAEVVGLNALAATTRVERAAPARYRAGLDRLCESVDADQAVIFYLDHAARTVAIVAQSGNQPLDPTDLYRLPESPVKDVIVEGETLWRNRVMSDNVSRFANLLALLKFESCIGIPLEVASRVEHALFLFAGRADTFDAVRLREATAAALLFQSLLESQMLEERALAVGQLLVTGELATAISHEVSNKRLTLASQIANARTAVGHATDSGNEADLREVGRWLDEMSRTVDGLRATTWTLVQLKDARQEQPVDIFWALQQAERQIALEAQRSNVLVRLLAPPDLPPALANPNRLHYVFLNLMLNAIRWTRALPERKGRVRVSVELVDRDGTPWLRVRFADNGPGIHYNLWERVFDMGMTTHKGGSGLGLYIARSLVEAMGGRLYVAESLRLLGTTFVAELPAVRVL
ncbi:MAG: S1 RNA-binding domain-containing protein [Anaerolineae bacterium]|nr:S1 RNA-binding domain-containing protein [Anaerolineae bacterium]